MSIALCLVPGFCATVLKQVEERARTFTSKTTEGVALPCELLSKCSLHILMCKRHFWLRVC